MTEKQLIDEIGEIEKEFKPAIVNLAAGGILGLLAISGGLTFIVLPIKGIIDSGGNLPWMVEKGWCWFAALGFMVMGAGLVLGGILLIRWVRSLASFRVWVGKNGIFVFDKSDARTFQWDDIVSVKEFHLYERPPLLRGPAKYVLPKFLSKSFGVKTKIGAGLKFDGNNVNKHLKLAEMIRAQTDPRAVPWEIDVSHGY